MFSLSLTVVSLLYTVSAESLSSYGGGGDVPGLGGGGGGDGGGDYDYSEGSLEDTIPGTPGVDYPVLASVPDTGFSCDGRVRQILSLILNRNRTTHFFRTFKSPKCQVNDATL